jgi:hypothetical protein
VSRRSLGEWRRMVYRSPLLSDPQRVVLLLLADHMRADRKVSVPCCDLAAVLGKSERRIGHRIGEAIERGFLVRVKRGQKGVTAEYQGTFPNAVSVTPGVPAETAFSRTATSPLRKAPGVPAETTVRRTHGGPTTTTAEPRSDPHHRDVGNDEKTEDQPAPSDDQVCECHGFPDCASLNRPRTREESA